MSEWLLLIPCFIAVATFIVLKHFFKRLTTTDNTMARSYRAIIYAVYTKLYYGGEIFTQSMERNIQEVEEAVELQRRGSVLKRRKY